MPTTTSQDQVLDSIRTSQEASVNAVRSWAETVAKVTPNVFDLYGTPKFDNAFGYAEKLWAAQRDFYVNMFEAAAPVANAAGQAARRVATSASPKS